MRLVLRDVVRSDRLVKQGARLEPEELDDIEPQLLVIVEVLQETLVDGVQVDDERVTRRSHLGASPWAEPCQGRRGGLPFTKSE